MNPPSRFCLAFVTAWTLIAAARGAEMQILFPLYSYPNWYSPSTYIWKDIATAAATVPVTAVINPSNGPGGPPNTDYIHGMNDLQAGGVTMLGYVHTSRGNRLIGDAEADIDIYDQQFSAYGVSGIFLDEASTVPAMLAYYTTLYNYVKGKAHLGKVVANPGTNIPEAFVSAPASDTVVIYEDVANWLGYAEDSYVGNYGNQRFSALILAVQTAAQMHTDIGLAAQRNAGYVFVTDATTPNPYGALPSYWTDEVNYIATNINAAPAPAATTLAASALTATGARLNGAVNANGTGATVSFDYGPTNSYGSGAPGSPTPVTGSGAVAVSANLSGLSPGATYHFRVNGASPSGTTHGGDLSFTTLSNNANLSSLSLSSGTLSPAFAAGITSYSASVAYSTASVTVTPTVAQANATVKVNGAVVASGGASGPISLAVGSNTVTVAVTAQDGSTNAAYTVAVTRLTNLNTWRQTYFPGSTATTGPGADAATPQNDGIVNLIKFATGLDPTKPGTMPGGLSASGGNLLFKYTPSALAVADSFTFTVEYANTLASGSWASDIVNQGSIGAGGSLVTATVPEGSAGRRFLHLKIAGP